jgi:hypothetical protein
VTWKSAVGTCSSDALSISLRRRQRQRADILGEDYGEGASIMQERTHAFAMKSQIWHSIRVHSCRPSCARSNWDELSGAATRR